MSLIFSIVFSVYALLFDSTPAAILGGAWLIYYALALFNNNFVQFGNNVSTYIQQEINKDKDNGN